MAQDLELDIIVDEPDVARRRWIIGGAAAVAIVVVGFIVYSLVLSDDDGSAVEQAIEEVAVERGTLTDTLVTTGSAAASRQSELLFPSGGQVAEVAVELGDTLAAGQVLASLDDGDAERDVETAQANLDLAVLRLDQMTEPPTSAERAAAESSVEQARAALERLIAAPTEAAVASADASVEQARSSFESLTASPSASDVAAAEVAVEQAQTSLERLLNTASPVIAAEADLASASRQVATAWASLGDALTRYCDGIGRRSIPSLCEPGSIPLSDESVEVLSEVLIARVSDPPSFTEGFTQLLQADATYKNVLDSQASAQTALTLAMNGRTDPNQGPTDQELEEARASLQSALARRAELDEGPPQHEINQANAALQSALSTRAALDEPPAQYEIDQAEAALRSAEAGLSELIAGASATDIQIQEQSVRLAEIALQQAEERLGDLTLRAPYSGVVASVGVVPGDSVSASTVAFVVTDPRSIGVDITVSESDLVGLQPGQLALAQFDSIEGQSYLLQISGIDTNPAVTQGVVTYTVRAEMVNPAQLGDRQDEVQELLSQSRAGGTLAAAAFAGGGAGGGQAGAFTRGRGGGGGGQGRGGFGGGGGGRGGAAFQECIHSVLGRTPSGRGDISAAERAQIQQECAGGGGGAGAQGGAGAGQAAPDATLSAPSEMPTPGMNASVTVLLDIKSDVLLVPSATVRQQGSNSFVYVPAPDGEVEQKSVTLGGTDGIQTEIVSGLDEGDLVLMGAGLTALQAGDSQVRAFREVR